MTQQVPNMYPCPSNIQAGPFNPPQTHGYHYINTPPQLPRSSSGSESVQRSRDQHQLPNSSLTYRTYKLFRPWEDKMASEGVEVARNNVHNLPHRNAEPSFVEDDFPSLQSGLSKMNIK